MKDRAAKAAYDRARYLRRRIDTRRATCLGCGIAIVQPRHGYRLYCTNACKYRVWYGAHAAAHPSTHDEIPMPYVGDPIFELARRATGVTGTSDHAQDILGEAVLAILEGRDPREAANAFKAKEAGHARAELRLDMGAIGLDHRGNVVISYQEAA